MFHANKLCMRGPWNDVASSYIMTADMLSEIEGIEEWETMPELALKGLGKFKGYRSVSEYGRKISFLKDVEKRRGVYLIFVQTGERKLSCRIKDSDPDNYFRAACAFERIEPTYKGIITKYMDIIRNQ